MDEWFRLVIISKKNYKLFLARIIENYFKISNCVKLKSVYFDYYHEFGPPNPISILMGSNMLIDDQLLAHWVWAQNGLFPNLEVNFGINGKITASLYGV